VSHTPSCPHAYFLSPAEEIKGKVVAIADGDTLTVLDDTKTQHKIRLIGIDCPEKKQPFGTKAGEVLGKKVFGKEVVVEWEKKDRYGRTLGKVVIDGRDIGLEMIQEGMAWHYASLFKSDDYAKAQEKAKSDKKGLWKDKKPVPPWEWREEKK
jgi:endonuclease YncB( thermonuclease family)